MKSTTIQIMWIYLLTFIGNLWFIGSQMNQLCLKQNLASNVEIQCSDMPLEYELEKTNYFITHQTITCSNPDKPIELTPDQMIHLKRLIFYHIENCLILDIPEHFFKNLIKLQAVILDNLPITKLGENVFKNSSNLIELTLSRLKKLENIHPRFLGHQNRLETLSLVESNIDSNQLRHILLPIYITLQQLYWRKNVNKLTLHREYFQNFQFDILVLEYNGIENIDFLQYVSTKYLSLKGNPIGNHIQIDFNNHNILLDVLTVLDLSETQIDQIFPNSMVTFPTLTELILRDNRIDEIPTKMEFLFPRLKILDLRNNKLTIIPSLNHILKGNNFGKVYLDGNRFHCNCQMSWVQNFNGNQIKDLYCQITSIGNSSKQILFTNDDAQSNMVCTAPKLYMKIKPTIKALDYSSKIINQSVKLFKIDIYPGEVFQWQCIGEGDPAPILNLIENNQNITTINPPSDKHQTQTILSNLIISYNNFNESQHEFIYICQANNIIGHSELQLQFIKNNKSRSVLGKIQTGNLIRENNKFALKNNFNRVVLSFMIIYRFSF